MEVDKQTNVFLEALQGHKGYIHPQFGDLSRKDSVDMYINHQRQYKVTEKSSLYIHLSVTGSCYARCKGCINATITCNFSNDLKEFSLLAETDPDRDANCIIQLAKKNGDEDELTVCFYGGEPLLAVEKINKVYKIIDNSEIQNKTRYMIYTNGELIKTAIHKFPKLMRNVWLYAVSIDGTRQQHERVRAGTNLAKIHDNLAALKMIRNGYVLMWSTLREDQSLIDCFDEYMMLNRKGDVDHFFWHWIETDEPFTSLDQYIKHYELDLIRVMDTYMEWLSHGKILSLVHINELIVYLLIGKKRNASACGVELANNYDLIGGKIHSCADLPPELAIGYIDEFAQPVITQNNLSSLIEYKKELGCYQCGIHDYCGGRCPVQAFTKGFKRMIQYCQLMRLHVGVIKSYIDEIIFALNNNCITLQDLYNKSAFYAQFTDGTP